MSLRPELQWQLGRRLPSWRWLLAIAVPVALALWLSNWQSQLDVELRQVEARLAQASQLVARGERSRPVRAARRDPVAERQLREQAAQLNRDWAGLTSVLAPRSKKTRLLSVEANPSNGSVRVGGRAATATAANAYARRLEGQGETLANVRLLDLEWRADGVYFEVDAQWLR